MKTSVTFFALAATLLPVAGLTPSVAGQDLITTHQLDQSIDLGNVAAEPNGAISGTIVNRTGFTMRDVRL